MLLKRVMVHLNNVYLYSTTSLLRNIGDFYSLWTDYLKGQVHGKAHAH